MKKTFAPKTFAAVHWLSGHWGGGGLSGPRTVPDGIDYRSCVTRLHFEVVKRRLVCVPFNKLDLSAP